jgi:transketolase
MRKSFVRALVELAAHDPAVVLMTADLGYMVLEEFAEAYPQRFFNVGVAEANMVGLATGLASCGYRPYVYSIATFASMRPYEQIRNGPLLHDLPVRIVGVGGGFEYGAGGITHHALEDLSIARVQPGLRIIAPADPQQAYQAITQTHALSGPTYFRLGKKDDYALAGLNGAFSLGKLDIIRHGSAVLFVSLGAITREVLGAADLLASRGLSSTVAVVSSLRPAPSRELIGVLSQFDHVITVEEHYIDGALGSLVCELVAENSIACHVTRLGVVRAAPEQCGSESYLRGLHGLDAQGIAAAADEQVSGFRKGSKQA